MKGFKHIFDYNAEEGGLWAASLQRHIAILDRLTYALAAAGITTYTFLVELVERSADRCVWKKHSFTGIRAS